MTSGGVRLFGLGRLKDSLRSIHNGPNDGHLCIYQYRENISDVIKNGIDISRTEKDFNMRFFLFKLETIFYYFKSYSTKDDE